MENNLKSIRLEKGLTQQEVADELNVTRQTVSHWEKAQPLPPALALVDLSKLYNESISRIIGENRMITKKQLNFMALVGVLTLNYFLIPYLIPILSFLLIFIFFILVGVAFPFWNLYLFIFKNQSFTVIETGESFLYFGLGMLGIIVIYYVCKKSFKYIKSYIRYNIHSVLYETYEPNVK
ncbi:XRE family transcriptional regulator [Weissella koreensis KACC 15510]|uniref:helix-turn-helix domain-containing protein n=1 Tax=Weissella koreensis TaxID=165096 RepID=UPI0002175A5D|nr:helix-turn-helix domain-containing protein [Weissella koreensis]AEJ23587.1 XRE family transcriptional regulator [Weissella koreensis KACC 15510]